MIDCIRYLKSDLYKLKHSVFFWLHLLFPICAAGLMLLYASFASVTDINKIFAFFQVIAIGYPFVISVVCDVVAEQEASAGHFQNILTLPHRGRAIVSKFLILVIFSILSLLGSAITFEIFLPITGANIPLSALAFIAPALVLWSSSILLYAFYLILAFRFGRNVCIGIGVVGSLLVALLQTGLGEGLWYVLPYGIGIRLSTYSLNYIFHFSEGINSEIKIAVISCVVLTITSIAVLLIWFSHYSGKRADD